MKASEVVTKLAAIIAVEGDLDVATYDSEADGCDSTSEIEVLDKGIRDDAELAARYVCIS
jgi:hypothetical protein